MDIKTYQSEIDVPKLNQWLNQLAIYFNSHNIEFQKNISCAQLKVEGHSQTWWESHTEMLRLERFPGN